MNFDGVNDGPLRRNSSGDHDEIGADKTFSPKSTSNAPAPWLTAIMPTFNGERYLRYALDSICQQMDDTIEVIIVDDGSTDSTLDIARSYLDRLPLKIIAGERRGSWIAGTNDGLRVASAPWSCFLHQDDYWFPTRLAEMRSYIDSFPECALYLHATEFRDEKDRPLGRWTCPLPGRTLLKSEWVTSRLVVQCFTAINAPIFRTEYARIGGGLDAALWYTADWDFWLRLAHSGPVVYCPKILAAFRVHSQSLTITGSRTLPRFREQLENVAEKWLAMIEAHNIDVASRARLSVELNVALAGANSGASYGPLLRALALLISRGPTYWFRFLRDTRIHQRVLARLKAKLLGTL